MMNCYTLEVYKKDNKPCFVATIKHIMRAGVYFFKTLKEANEFINENKQKLEPFGALSYNENGCDDDNFARVIKTVLSCDNIKIGEHDKTYC